MRPPQEFYRKWALSELEIAKRLIPLVKRHPWAVSVIMIIGCLGALLEGVGISLFIPLLYSLYVDEFIPETNDWLGQLLNRMFEWMPDANRLVYISLLILGLVFFRGILYYGGNILSAWLDARLSHHLCSKVYDQLLSVGMRFIEQEPDGKLMNTLENETYATSDAVAIVIDLVVSILTVMIFAAFLLLISWKLTFLVITVLVLISILIKTMTRHVKSLSRDGLAADESFSQHILDLFRGLRTIRAYARELYERKRFESVLDLVNKINIKLEIYSGFIEPLSEALTAVLIVFILLFASQYPISFPAVLVFIFILYRLRPYFAGLDETRTALMGSIASVEAVTALLERQNKPYIQSGHDHFHGLQDSIKFDSVCFQYEPNGPQTLQDITIKIPRGKTTAVVGPSGAGKSTLIHLLIRFYEPSGGKIYVDSLPLEKLNLTSWRSRLAVVDQEEYIFNTTVRKNIAYGRLDAENNEIVTAAELASADQFIQDLPKGYDTILGDQGVRLSAGQKQRISIARAIVRNPEIILLDEATNALDSISENHIHNNLRNLPANHTIITVAHRLSSIEQADHIVVLEAGRIVEQGNSRQLLNNKALFAKLHAFQRQNNHSPLDNF